MEEELRALLLAATTVTDISGSRINFGARPQGQMLPAIVLNTISGAIGLVHSGPDGMLSASVQVDCYAHSYGAAKALSLAVIGLLHGHRSGAFKGVFLTNTRDSREGGSNEAERPFRVSLDFDTHWRADNG